MKNIHSLPYFSTSQFANLYSSKKVAFVNISRALEKENIVKIKRWYYVSKDFVKEIYYTNKTTSYIEFLATNILYTPSYLSLEYVLYEHNIITENVYNFTLLTTKKTNSFSNDFWKFQYRNIKKEFFWDYEIVKKDWFLVYKASPEKALFDYLYLKKDIIFEFSYFKELRLNMENVNLRKFEKLLKKYKSPKMQKIFIFLKQLKWL